MISTTILQPDGAADSYRRSAEEVMRSLASDLRDGLTEASVLERRRRYGANEFTHEDAIPAWKKFASQFASPVIWLLFAAAAISGMLGEWIDSTAILAIVILNGLFGYLQEARAEKALQSLKLLAPLQARVIRSSAPREVLATELVPGDIVLMEAGDHIPADIRLLESYSFAVQEASVTGESTPVSKDAQTILPPDASLGDRTNMAYVGSIAVAGKAKGVVVRTGMATELGMIAGLIRTYHPGPTPLQQSLARIGRTLALACLVIVAIIFLLQLWHQRPIVESLLVSISLAVAAVPEGLPAVVTISLAIGLQRMARRNALMRNLSSVETLGCVTVICSDKTGTLTKNEMTVCEVFTAGASFQVTGTGYAPYGEFEPLNPRSSNDFDPKNHPEIIRALRIGVYCNNASIAPDPGNAEQWTPLGDPTECALVSLAMKGGVQRDARAFHIEHELPFDSDRKAMSVVVRSDLNGRQMFTKGALESLLAKISSVQVNGRIEPFTTDHRSRFVNAAAEMSGRALRVLALAERAVEDSDLEYPETDLTIVALVGMIDPPRDEAKLSIAQCRRSGITPVMITGDHPATAIAIGRQLGISVGEEGVVLGSALDAMSEDQLDAAIQKTSIFARVTAYHKLRVVQSWKRCGQVVAMTGDGVNDAPAVKAADIGIAMGLKGTDVTREASAMVLLDDNFASIISAVEEGRTIYSNIRKFLVFLLSCNIGEMVVMFVASLAGLPTPLLAIHLLWINIVTDGFAALALAMEPPEPDVMLEMPRSPRSQMLTWRLGKFLCAQGFLIAAVALAAFWLSIGPLPEELAKARMMAFCVLVFAELFRAFAVRSRKWTFFQLGVWTNPYLVLALAASGLLQLAIATLPAARAMFATVPLTFNDWMTIMGLALIPVSAIEVAKLLKQKLFHNGGITRT